MTYCHCPISTRILLKLFLYNIWNCFRKPGIAKSVTGLKPATFVLLIKGPPEYVFIKF